MENILQHRYLNRYLDIYSIQILGFRILGTFIFSMRKCLENVLTPSIFLLYQQIYEKSINLFNFWKFGCFPLV